MYQYKATIQRVVDGDTVIADIDLGFDVHVIKRLRIADYDAPEIYHPKSADEKALGLQAKERAEALLMEKQVVLRSGRTQGKYGRWIASISVDGKDFVAVMKSEGFVKETE